MAGPPPIPAGQTPQCTNCNRPVSAQAFECPGCGHPLRKLRRGPGGQIAKWIFILFNLLMIYWIFSYVGSISDMNAGTTSDAERAGVAVGGTLGVGFLLVIWVLGDIILGLFALLTRAKR